ncbi:putative transcriptional regulatory protein NarL [Emticicia aquatica]|uniref:Transcriptional regulatory protein NarL n=1 Tax=Emticicia aquatica TaxID=1681835 RepID=A0ABM9AKW6_9BACT|nr:response regulator transcription factor [Emticicia aquatica]CAH0994232.1 putative transcriptional regulatory protein NarL [Emticicia aquatica]
MPRKKITGIVALKNSFASAYISQILVNSNISLIAQIQDYKSLLQLVKLHKPVIVICDEKMEDANSFILEFNKVSIGTSLILISETTKIESVMEYLHLGFMGVLKYDSEVSELNQGISTVLQGNKFLSQEYLKMVEPDKMPQKSILEKLSIREKEVMNLIGQGKNNYEIASALKISHQTVNNHRAKIRRKMQIQGGKSALLQLAISAQKYV